MKRNLLFLFLCLLMFIQEGWAAETIKIGFMGPMSGDFAVVGKEGKQVLTLLAEEINNRGGLMDRRVELLFEDDGGNPEAAAPAGKRLLDQGVVAVVGSFKSTVTESLQMPFSEGKIIHITYGSTSASLTEKGLPFFFRTCPQDEEQAKAVVRVIRKMKIKKAALIHDNSLYGRELAERVRNHLQDWMIDIVSYDGLTPGQKNYRPVLEKVRATGPELVFFAGYYPEAARLLLAREQMDWKAPFMGGDAVNNPDLIKIAGKKAAYGFSFLSPPAPRDLHSPRAKQFLARYLEVFGEKPTSIYAILAGDAFLAVTDSIQKLSTADALRIADYLHRHYFNTAGLSGTLYFNYRGDMVNDLHGVYHVDDEGRFILGEFLQHGQMVK
ncbi:MAG: branched-chain amino acid ABC transporter substrate-binding protein [Syntrophales bacterium]|nr:branched-chain amino acid ABC transporter substrate-binding protein [Syntrophales bacterium]